MRHISFIEWVNFDSVQAQQCKRSSGLCESEEKKISMNSKAERCGLCEFGKACETNLSGFSYMFVLLGLAGL